MKRSQFELQERFWLFGFQRLLFRWSRCHVHLRLSDRLYIFPLHSHRSLKEGRPKFQQNIPENTFEDKNLKDHFYLDKLKHSSHSVICGRNFIQNRQFVYDEIELVFLTFDQILSMTKNAESCHVCRCMRLNILMISENKRTFYFIFSHKTGRLSVQSHHWNSRGVIPSSNVIFVHPCRLYFVHILVIKPLV